MYDHARRTTSITDSIGNVSANIDDNNGNVTLATVSDAISGSGTHLCVTDQPTSVHARDPPAA